jgi:heterodisulfide reductase subunit C
MDTKAKKILFLFIYYISPIFVSIIYWIEEPFTYPESFDLAHKISSVLGIFAFIWMCFNIIIMIKIKAIESNFSLDWLNIFHRDMATTALILGSVHYFLLRIGGVFDVIQMRTGNFGWASFVLLMALAIIFMSNSLGKKIGKLRVSAYNKKFKYSVNKVLHNLLMVSVSLIFIHTINSFTARGSMIMRGVYIFFFGITFVGWVYHKLIRRFRANNDPYLYRKASWDEASSEIISEKNKEWALGLIKLNPSLYPCLQCGVCTTECPVSVATKGAYNPRRNILATLSGFKDFILEGEELVIWGCTTCHTCDEVCPQNIELTNLFTSLKNQSIARNKGPDSVFKQARAIFDNAKAIPSQPAMERRRQELGLPAVLKPDVNEIQTLLRNLGINKKLEMRKQPA